MSSVTGSTPGMISFPTNANNEPENLEEQPIVEIKNYWDVTAPAPKSSVKGHFMKGFLQNIGKKRRISLEVHRIPVAIVASGGDNAGVGDGGSTGSISSTTGGGSYVEKRIVRISKKKKKQPSSSPNGAKYTDLRHSDRGHESDDDSSIGSDSAMSSFTANGKTIVEFPDDLKEKGQLKRKLSIIDESNSKESGQHHQPQLLSSPDHATNGTKWVTKYKIEVSDFFISKMDKSKITFQPYKEAEENVFMSSIMNHMTERTIQFHSTEDARDFHHQFTEMKKKCEDGAMKNWERKIAGLNLSESELDKEVDFLIDIIGAEKIVVADFKSSDPFVVVQFGGKEIHRTKRIDRNLNPIYTLSKQSLFIFSITPRKLLQSDGMTFIVYDYDLNGNDILGGVSVPSKTLYLANEERIEMELQQLTVGRKRVPDLPKNKYLGTIAISCRKATDDDKRFLNTYKEDAKKRSVVNKKSHKPPNILENMIVPNTKVFRGEHGEKIEKFRIRPNPDPKTPKVEWMTKEEIDTEVMKPSYKYKSIGADGIAKIHLEILSCDNLPNMENIQMFGNKTDAFVQLVYEDCVGTTSVIDDSSSPRWMPWCDRAFILHTKHPSAVIYIGVHDCDNVTDHDLVGRCAVDVTNLKPSTEYILHYALHKSGMIKDEKKNKAGMTKDEKKRGTIKMRLRLEVNDPREYVLASLKIPPSIYVNSKSYKKFQCIRDSVHGNHDLSKYNLANIMALVQEIIEQRRVIFYVKHIGAESFFWRGSHKVAGIRVPRFLGSCPDNDDADLGANSSEGSSWLEKYTKKKDISVPLNSICIFVTAIIVVENPRFLPSVAFFSIGWLLLMARNFRAQYPNPWWRCNSPIGLLMALILGKEGKRTPETIDVNKNKDEAKEKDEYWANLIKTEEEEAARRSQELYEEQLELDKDLLEIKGDADDFSTRILKFNVDPLILVKSYLYPIQQNLIMVCNAIRIGKNILLWDESHYSFFVTISSFALSALFLIIPWVFILRWSTRILVWGLLGPWMRYFDPTLSVEKKNDEEQSKADKLRRKLYGQETLAVARLQNEKARKYRDFKMHFFGKYLVKVPIIRLDRYLDLPLPSSSATPLEKEAKKLGEIVMEETEANREAGQQLVGTMIPKIQEIPRTVAPIGQPTKHKSLIKIGDLGADVGNDSAIFAYIKIGSMVLVASGVTYFVVPLMIDSARSVVYVVVPSMVDSISRAWFLILKILNI